MNVQLKMHQALTEMTHNEKSSCSSAFYGHDDRWEICPPLPRKCILKFSLEQAKENANKRRKLKTMVHLHNGILRSREKEGAYTLCNSMDGTGEHYVK